MDKAIKYLVINTLYYANDPQVIACVNAIEVQSYHDDLFGDDPSYEWFDCIPEIAQAYDNIPLNTEQLANVEYLSGESCQLHHAIMPNWDGEGDDFDPSTLEGLELLPNLTTIKFINFERIKDFSPLFTVPLTLIDESSGIDQVTKQTLKASGVTLGLGLN